MASVDLAHLSKESHDELACTYAALILHDSESEITADKISAVLAASKNTVESYWPMLFANALKNADVGSLLFSVGSGSGGSAEAGPAVAVEEAKVEEAPVEEEAEEDDFGFDLFG
jgi:large subunit ribosomal protein LP1